MGAEVVLARDGGAHGSENVGMSSKNFGEKPKHRKSKVSWAMFVTPGLVGPKARPKGVVEGRAGQYSCTTINFRWEDAVYDIKRDLVMLVDGRIDGSRQIRNHMSKKSSKDSTSVESI